MLSSCDLAVWWCDLEIQVWNPGTYNKQFAMYLQEKVIENFNFRDPTSTAPFRHTEYGNEWFWCRNNETRLNGTTGIQPVMNALSTTNNVQTAMTTILNDHIQYITNTVIPDPNAPAVLQNWAAWWPNNIPTQYTNSARYMRRLIALDRSVERILNAAGRARAGAGLQNLLVDLNWLRNNVNNLVQVRNANDLNVRFLNHATAEVFFNYYLWTG